MEQPMQDDIKYSYDVYDGENYCFTIIDDNIDGSKKLENFFTSELTILKIYTGARATEKSTIIEIEKIDASSFQVKIYSENDKNQKITGQIFKTKNPSEIFTKIKHYVPFIFTVKRYTSIDPNHVDSPAVNPLREQVTIVSKTKTKFQIDKERFNSLFPIFVDSVEYDNETSEFQTSFSDPIIYLIVKLACRGIIYGLIEPAPGNVDIFIEFIKTLDYVGYVYNKIDIDTIKNFMNIMDQGQLGRASLASRTIVGLCVELASRSKIHKK